jgi:DNA relaxase NicK
MRLPSPPGTAFAQHMDDTQNPAAPLSAGYDFITYTVPRHERCGRTETLAGSILLSEAARGGLLRVKRMSGYIGRQAGAAFFGERHDGFLIQISGAASHRWVERLAELPGQVTRLDVAVTALMSQPVPDYVDRRFSRWQREPRLFGGVKRARLWMDESGGKTMYLGSSQSDTLLRLYDHGVRHGYAEPGKSLRWEAQLRRLPARAALATLVNSSHSELAMGGLVYSLFSDRQVPPEWIYKEVRITPARRGTTDVQGKLDWLEKSVKGTVGTLIAHGYLDEVLCALGIKDLS